MKDFITRNLAVIAGFALMLLIAAGMFAIHQLSPEIRLIGDKEVVVSSAGEFIDPGAKANLGDKDLTDKIKIKGKVNLKKPGTYKLTYSVSHKGLTSKTSRTVKVVDDVEPVITLNGLNPYNLCPHKEYAEPGYSATDNLDGDLTSKVKVTAGMYDVVYEVTDKAGNTAMVSRAVNREDKEAPVITLAGDEVMSIIIGSGYAEPGYTAADAFDTEIQGKVLVTGEVNTGKAGTYTIRYEATDCSGNVGTATRTVVVRAASSYYGGGGNGSGSTIYLTFDDGPSSTITPGVLDILAQEGVKATFFVVGIYADDYGYLMRRIVAEGHTIGIHCYTHNYATVYASVDAYFNDLYSAVERVRQETGVESKIIRFPGGSSNTVSRNYSPGIMSVLVREVQARGFHYFDWNVGSGDTGNIGASGVYNTVVSGLKNQGTCVVLMHDRSGNYQTLEALRDIIRYGKSHGYSFDRITMSTPQIHHGVAN